MCVITQQMKTASKDYTGCLKTQKKVLQSYIF